MLSEEPQKYSLKPGTVVYVDDHTCLNGLVKRITAGASASGSRKIECVPRP